MGGGGGSEAGRRRGLPLPPSPVACVAEEEEEEREIHPLLHSSQGHRIASKKEKREGVGIRRIDRHELWSSSFCCGSNGGWVVSSPLSLKYRVASSSHDPKLANDDTAAPLFDKWETFGCKFKFWCSLSECLFLVVPCCSNTGAGRLLSPLRSGGNFFFLVGVAPFSRRAIASKYIHWRRQKMYAQWLVSQPRTSSTLLIESRCNASRRRSLKRKGWGGMPFAGQSMTKWNGGGEGTHLREWGLECALPIMQASPAAMRRCTIIASEGEKCRRGLYKVRIVVTE